MDIGCGEGKYFSLNVPFKERVSDEQFVDVFKEIMEAVRQHYRPDCVVLQCGADSLAYDKLGTHNTRIKGHGTCVEIIKSWCLPTILLGGGGYTIKNVSRCWAYETGLSVGLKDLDNQLPLNDFYEYYAPEYTLHFKAKDEVSNNTKDYLEFVKRKCLEHLKAMEFAPSVGI